MTVHEQTAEAALEDILTDPSATKMLMETRRKIKDQEISREYLNSIGQTHWNEKYWPMEQVAAWLCVHTDLMSGVNGEVWIEVGTEPSYDDDRIGNRDALADLPRPFKAVVDMEQNSQDQDGVLQWDEPIWVWKSVNTPYYDADGAVAPLMIRHKMAPGWAPLEIGSSKASRTMLHLLQDRGVARWAYGSDRICLMLAINRFVPVGL